MHIQDPLLINLSSMLLTMEPSNGEDQRLSAEATTVVFDAPIPPLRVPLPANQDDDPSRGPFVLAFKDQDTWLSAWQHCEVKVSEQCEAGARMGCSISATKKCQPPWWHLISSFLKRSHSEYQDREKCEDQEMLKCMTDVKEKCRDYAKGICDDAFSQARIACQGKYQRISKDRAREETV